MVIAAATNFSIGFILLVLILFRAGDVAAAIESPTGQPYIAILLNATGSVAGTSVLVAYIILALIFCSTNVVTTSSRQLFSFARDRGVPFSGWLSRVSNNKHVPAQAIICTISVTVLLSLILIGSSAAFNIIASLFGVALMGSYITSISTLIYQRLTGGHLPRTRFSLGAAGIYINFVTIAFDAFVFVMVSSTIAHGTAVAAYHAIDVLPGSTEPDPGHHELGIPHLLLCDRVRHGFLLGLPQTRLHRATGVYSARGGSRRHGYGGWHRGKECCRYPLGR